MKCLSQRRRRSRFGQAQTEYIIVVLMSFFAAVLVTNGTSCGGGHYIRQDDLVGRAGIDEGSDVDTSGIDVPQTQVFTIPGLKDVFYVYQDKLYRSVANKKALNTWFSP